MYYAYILENDKGWHYIGSCKDLKKRIKRHNQNSVRSTKNKGPFKLVFRQEFKTRREARVRENQLKRFKSRYSLIRLIDKKSTLSSSLA